MKKFTAIILSAAAVLSLASCGGNTVTENKTEDTLTVYTSFYAMADFAKEVGGDKVNVEILCPVGSEPHDFEPTASDMAKLTKADVFIYNGMDMEHWAESVAENLGNVTVVIASEGIEPGTVEYDPHIWLNPDKAHMEMENIAKGYIAADAENESYYREQLAACKEKTDALKAEMEDAAAGFKKKNIVTSHEAYSNLADALGIVALGVNNLDNSEDPTPTTMAKLEAFIKNNDIKYVFTEPLSSSAVMDTIAADTGCEVLTLDPFEGNAEGKGYFDVMYANLEALKTALN